MAKWTIHQMAEVWYETEVEAETFDEAIEASSDYGIKWQQMTETVEFTDAYWGRNQDTEEDFTSL